MPYKPTGRPPGRPRHPEPLTPAEQRVLRYLRQGRTNAEIADALDVSADAVKYHVSNMLGKLELENREQLAAWREPSAVLRAWAAMGGLGWKLAGGAAALVVATGVGVGGWLLLRGDGSGTEPADLRALATGVLSVGIDGQPANGPSLSPSISDDGRFVAFESEATNLVKDDTNGVSDIFVVDRADRSIRRVSLAPGGKEANGASHRPAISGDGKWVAFDSEASNLVKDDVNGELDRVLALLPEELREILTSRGSSAIGAGFMGGSDVFVVGLETGSVELASATTDGERGTLGSYWPSISRDGRFVAFESVAPNFTGGASRQFPSTGINYFLASDVLMRDRKQQTTTRITTAPDGQPGGTGSGSAVVSSDGSTVAFTSSRTDLAGEAGYNARAAYVWQLKSNKLDRVPLTPAPADSDGYLFVGGISRPAITGDGRVVAFALSASAAKRPNPEGIEVSGVYVYRAGNAAPQMIPNSEESGQMIMLGAFTNDGRELLFQGVESQVFHAAAYDLATNDVVQIGTGIGSAVFQPTISGDGRWVAVLDDTGGTRSTGVPLFQVVVVAR